MALESRSFPPAGYMALVGVLNLSVLSFPHLENLMGQLWDLMI